MPLVLIAASVAWISAWYLVVAFLWGTHPGRSPRWKSVAIVAFGGIFALGALIVIATRLVITS